ncbi:hypothetical protein ACVWXN_007713 [Bradyrhizobium sp. i1.4.4]
MIACTPPRFSVRAKCSAKSKAARIMATPKMPTSAAVPVKAADASIKPPPSCPSRLPCGAVTARRLNSGTR